MVTAFPRCRRLLTLSSLSFLYFPVYSLLFLQPTPTATCTKRKQRRQLRRSTRFHAFAETPPAAAGSPEGKQRQVDDDEHCVIHCRKILKARSNRETSSKTRYSWPFQSENASSFPAEPAFPVLAARTNNNRPFRWRAI